MGVFLFIEEEKDSSHFCFSGFIEDNPEGTLTKEKMMEMYSAVLSVKKAEIFVDQIFSKFDTDENGSIDFKVSFLFKKG